MVSNAECAVGFMHLIAAGQVGEAYEQYVAPDFRHHNAYFPGDRESLKRGMEENAVNFPNKRFEVKRVIEDGEFAVVHSHMQLAPEGPELAMVHIFRCAREKIVELWDVGQIMPEEVVNENGMF